MQTDIEGKNRGSKPLLPALILIVMVLVLSGGVYSLVNRTLVESNIETMTEMAAHDNVSLNAILDDEWDSMDVLPSMLEGYDIQTEKQLLETLRIYNEHYTKSTTMLVDENGTCYRSDGVITEMPQLVDKLSAYDGNFVLRQDDDFRETVEAKKEYLVFGKCLSDIQIDGHTFKYAIRRVGISELDSKLRLSSFGGEGMASVIDKDGNFVIKLNRTGSVAERDNFLEKLQGAEFYDGLSYEEVVNTVQTDPDGVSFEAQYDGTRYVVHISALQNTDWYYASLVPTSVFSAVTNRILSLVFILILCILVAVLVMVVMWTRSQRERLKTAEEHRARLSEALDMAQQASRSKTVFLNNMSHDIRTPMNAIIGFTALAAKSIDSKETVLDYLAKISQSSDHLLSLINDILDMSRIESGKVTIDEKEEELSDILHGIRNIFLADIRTKNLDLFIDTMNIKNEHIICDKLRLNQVLLNILSNAVKYTPNGGMVSLKIRQEEAMPDGRCFYEFSIRDNGIGMSEEFAQTIFEPFTREKTSTISGIQGTGLGMAITKNIVDMMGGTITCSSKQGEGSEFVVRIPLRILENYVGESIDCSFANGIRALVVDDDMDACTSVAGMLREIGMRSEWCVSGKEAVVRSKEAFAIHDCYGTYIIDWLMPDMNGVETARRIRSVVGPDAPIIILSAYDYSNIEAEAKEAGVTAFINKPIFESDLKRTLAKAYGVHQTVEQEATGPSFVGKRILLVEDNELNQEIAIAILEDEGLEVETANNGQEACEVLLEKGAGYYDLVLMDIQMPVMDGYEATEQIRAFEDEELSNIPIFAMTANAFEEDKKKAFAAGMNGHIAKPINISMLMEELRKSLL